MALGVRAGDRVALLSSTRYEWNLIDFAIWAVGAVTVPVYDSSSADQIHWIMEDSAARLIIVENDTHATTAREGVQGLEVADVLVIDGATLTFVVGSDEASHKMILTENSERFMELARMCCR